MTTDTYNLNPALRPTVLVHDVMKTTYAYTTTLREMPAARPDATEPRIARETHRAA